MAGRDLPGRGIPGDPQRRDAAVADAIHLERRASCFHRSTATGPANLASHARRTRSRAVLPRRQLSAACRRHDVLSREPDLRDGALGAAARRQVGWRRWLAVLVGFAGVVIALRPSAATLTWPALIALTGSVAFALLMIVTRLCATRTTLS